MSGPYRNLSVALSGLPSVLVANRSDRYPAFSARSHRLYFLVDERLETDAPGALESDSVMGGSIVPCALDRDCPTARGYCALM